MLNNLNSNLNKSDKQLAFEKLQEKEINDYLITAIAKDIMGLSHEVNILCTVRSKYKRVFYLFHRLRDELEWLQVEENLDINIPRLDMIYNIGSRFFQTVILTLEDNKCQNNLNSFVYQVVY